MSISLGSKSMNDCYLGNKPVSEIYLGSKLVWSREKKSPLITLEPKIYYPFNEDCKDASGNNNNPIGFTNPPMKYYTTGFDGRPCLDLIDGNQCIKLPTITKATNNFTISLCYFCMPHDTNHYTGLFGGIGGIVNTNGGGYSVMQFYKGKLNSSNSFINFQWYPGNMQHCNGDGFWLGPVSNGWNHLLISYDLANKQVRCYQNGLFIPKTDEDTAPVTGPIQYTSYQGGWDRNMYLGKIFHVNESNGAFFYGYMQDFAFWDRTLSDSEVEEIVNWYLGNMIPNSNSIKIGKLVNKKGFVCTGGSGTSDNAIVPNNNKLANGGTLVLSASQKLYYTRSISRDIGDFNSETKTINKYHLVINEPTTNLNLNLLTIFNSEQKYLKINYNGSGSMIDVYGIINDNIFVKTLYKNYKNNITFKIFLPGMDEELTCKIDMTFS